jgi:archaetidylinositol phosphate synthase
MKRSDFFEAWSKLHGGAEIKGIVWAWLSLSYFICWPLAKIKISPNNLSMLAPFIALLFFINIDSNWAILYLVISLLLDGIDGSLAILRERVSKFGALLDAVMDRVTEFFWALAFIQLGAPIWVVTAAAVLAFGQEYLRARSGGLGIHEVVMVTIAERPVRATLIFIPLIARIFEMDLSTIFAILWLMMQSFSFTRLFLALRSRLQQSQR